MTSRLIGCSSLELVHEALVAKSWYISCSTVTIVHWTEVFGSYKLAVKHCMQKVRFRPSYVKVPCKLFCIC